MPEIYIGNVRGPVGPKGDPLRFEDLTPEQIEQLRGPQGPQGDQGPQGLKGDKGDTGDVGEQGLKGDTGDQGPQGLKGDTGEQGPQGPQGLKGLKGDTGPTPNAYVTESWREGSNWYRKWSNGTIEQGGVQAGAKSGLTNIAFFTPFPGVNYSFVGSLVGADATARPALLRTKKANQIAVNISYDADGINWYVCGV